MSQVGSNLGTIADILKIDYRDPIVEQLNNKTLLMHRLESTSEFTVGDQAYFPLHTGRNEGIGARKEADNTSASTLPVAGAQKYSKATYGMTYQYGSARFTGPAIASARDNEGSFARLVDSEMKGLVNDTSRDMNRQLFGPKSGKMAVVITPPSGTPSGGGSLTANQIEVRTRQFMRVGLIIDIVQTGGSLGTVTTAGAEIIGVTSIDGFPNNVILTFGAAPTAVATDIVVRTDSFNLETFGLIDLISDKNPEDIVAGSDPNFLYVGAKDRDVAANDFWKANVINHQNAAFADTLFQDAIDLVDIEGDGDLTIFVTDHVIFNAYGNSLLPQRRFNTEGSMFQMLDGGFKSLDYEGIPVAKDRDCQRNTIWGIAEDRIKYLHMADWEWMDKDGSVLARVPGKDAYDATLFKYCELAINDPKDNVQIANVGTVV